MKTIAHERLHDQHCRCRDCPQAEAPKEFLSGNDMALIGIGALIFSLVLLEVIDWWISGPGVIPELGL
ncbi:hypothetical protein AV944_00570 [Sphingomonas sp. LK11]|uniref:hypothetical protein n=1 Tax=Sphingomonas sp. LK11 TaxID=1390395 RepID=UPI0009728D04|nr:hypothetical protein [Sphingomonas sp. LK11]APX64592.1 hypothetical protein AV944_00570 [Sphingomonas sp. LK11]